MNKPYTFKLIKLFKIFPLRYEIYLDDELIKTIYSGNIDCVTNLIKMLNNAYYIGHLAGIIEQKNYGGKTYEKNK
jgi:hypothetical protein